VAQEELRPDDSVPLRRRRVLLLALAAGAAGCQRANGNPPAKEVLSAEDKALAHKFRGLDGGELFVDAFGQKEGVNIFDETGKLFYKSATLSARNNSKHSYGARFGVPKTLRAEWRDRYLSSTDPYEPPPPGHDGASYYGGKILGNYTVPVASRIPDDLLDAVRQRKGGLRLKIRLHDDGLLIGWDLSRGFNLQYFAGGDFREADIENGKVVRKGWYIHPKTKERIETDF
jgi:hypothetical protein